MPSPDFLLNPKTAQIVTGIKRLDEPYAQKLARRTETTYSHTCKTLAKLMDDDIDINPVKKKQKGRKRIYTLTEEGEKLAQAYEQLLSQVDEEKLPNPALIA